MCPHCSATLCRNVPFSEQFDPWEEEDEVDDPSSTVDPKTRTRFHDFVVHDDVDGAADVLRHADAEDTMDLLNGTGFVYPLLTVAAISSSVEMVRLLLENGADVDSGTRAADPNVGLPGGSTALACALSQGRAEVVRELLAAGADPNVRDEDSNTPLMLATRFEEHDNHAVMTRALLDAGGSPHDKSWAGWLPFHYAAGRGSVEAAEMLLDREPSSLNVTTSNGATALYLAATEPGMDRMVSRLLARGATNVAVLGNGSCPLTGAVHYSLESMVSVILNEGFDAVGGPVALPR